MNNISLFEDEIAVFSGKYNKADKIAITKEANKL